MLLMLAPKARSKAHALRLLVLQSILLSKPPWSATIKRIRLIRGMHSSYGSCGPLVLLQQKQQSPHDGRCMGAGCGEEAGRRRTSNSMSNSITIDPTEAAVDGGTCQVGQ